MYPVEVLCAFLDPLRAFATACEALECQALEYLQLIRKEVEVISAQLQERFSRISEGDMEELKVAEYKFSKVIEFYFANSKMLINKISLNVIQSYLYSPHEKNKLKGLEEFKKKLDLVTLCKLL